MLLPCITYFILFSYLPMAGLVLAFKEFKFNTGIWGGEWVGFTYFQRFFNDPQSWVFIKNTLIISSMKLFLGLPFPIFLALMFNEMKSNKMRNLFQSITYLPHFLSWVIIVGLLQRVLAPDIGLLNQVIKHFGGAGDKFFLMEKNYFYSVMFWSHVWKEIGWNSIIYFAAIAGINPEYYEAAKMDGANKLRQIWHITLPGIRPTIIILFILSLGNILSAGFDQIYLLKTPGNAEVAEIIDTYVIRVGLQGGQFGYATAVGMLQGVIGLILVLAVNAISKRKFDTSLW
ncbi:sugar ABC transporter permease [Bacillus sp. FJAT-49682]|uniref:Sugar ABC transporter permease n=2 Tax=Lederbergia citrea TaxID=2833581 RepID=A0A942UY01_9BACI|nr:sugar ABC transporter permease [Lederbergia citrea]